jgi:peptide-methionine (S)-S-oxide reductase
MKQYFKIIPLFVLILVLFSCEAISQKKTDVRKVKLTAPQGKAIAAFAEGCFWCSEHIFEAVVGVDSAISGYAGGNVPNPTYDLVNTETTGHAETVLVYYNPKLITYAELCKVFFASHDPTTPNQQGPDRGSSYRSILFYTGEAEKAAAQQSVKDATNAGRFKKSILRLVLHKKWLMLIPIPCILTFLQVQLRKFLLCLSRKSNLNPSLEFLILSS